MFFGQSLKHEVTVQTKDKGKAQRLKQFKSKSTSVPINSSQKTPKTFGFYNGLSLKGSAAVTRVSVLQKLHFETDKTSPKRDETPQDIKKGSNKLLVDTIKVGLNLRGCL